MKSLVNILLVDDESRNLDALESILTVPDLQLVRARTPDEALLALMNGEFACIVLDIQMPTMNGIELAKLIKTRKRTQHIPIIFLTAYFLDERDILQGYGVGAVDYLTKPVSPQVLKSKVGVFVDLFRTTRALADANSALETEILQRKTVEEALRQVNNDLETRVNERTSELKKAHDELLAASRAKDDFLATLSHELRTPLNPVLLLASAAADDHDLQPGVRADFNTIRKNVELEARLIDDLLDLTRITRGKIILEKNFLDVHKILLDTVGTVQPEIEQKKIELALKLDAQQRTVFGDAVRLQQIFWNLLKNAVKFTPPSGHITIQTTEKEDKLMIKVSDTGIGMNAGEIANVFNAFSPGSHATGNGHRFGGLGLGLAISQKLMEFHSGRIYAESEGRGKGATFTIELPLSDSKKSDDAELKSLSSPSLPSLEPEKKSDLRILLVEDHEPTRNTLAHLLTRRYYHVTTAASVVEARNLAYSQHFDLLISDIGLPDGNGYDLMAELRRHSDLRGIALTGYGMEQDHARSQGAGFLAHLTKPVRIQSLENAILTATRRKECPAPTA